MKVLVTGGGGFLGRGIVRHLLARGDRVRIFNRSRHPDLEARGMDCLCGDIADAGAVQRAAEGIEAVIHVAAKAGPGLYWPDFRAANITGTENVLAACRAHGIRWLVYTSSPSIVHSGTDIEGADESLPVPPHHHAPYPATKAVAEELVLSANGPDLATCALRPHLIWGAGDNQLLPRLLEMNRAGRLRMPGPDKKIDTVYIDNAARAHLLALDNLRDSGTAAGRAYFISNDEPLATADIVARMIRAAGDEPRIRTVSPGMARAAATVVEAWWRLFRLRSDPPLSRFVVDHLATAHWFDISAAKRDLGYRPEVSIEEGLKRLAAAPSDPPQGAVEQHPQSDAGK